MKSGLTSGRRFNGDMQICYDPINLFAFSIANSSTFFSVEARMSLSELSKLVHNHATFLGIER
jgi:hypothetical protein